MQYNSITLISNNLEVGKQIALDLWNINKTWVVVTCDNCLDYEYLSFIKKMKTITVTDSKCFENIKPNKFIKYCERYKVCPIFITDKSNNTDTLQHTMYKAIGEVLQDSVEYIHDSKDKDTYNELIGMLKVSLW